MKRTWIVGGWLIALLSSAGPSLWATADRVRTNHLGKYIDPLTGAWTSEVYWQFLRWWLPVAVPASLLALACMYLNRPED